MTGAFSSAALVSLVGVALTSPSAAWADDRPAEAAEQPATAPVPPAAEQQAGEPTTAEQQAGEPTTAEQPAVEPPAAEQPAPPAPPPSAAPPAAPHAIAKADDDLAAAATAGEVIVVTGTRSEVPLSASPVTTEVIDRRRLEESGVQTVSEALSLRPGLWIDRGVAGTTGVTIQGLGPQYSLILVDGARQIGRTDGYLDLDRFGIGDIEQIEIVRGPSSALYGADALGGVVNIITRKPTNGFSIDAASQLDDRLATTTRARVSAGRGKIAAAVSGEFRDSPAVRRGDEDATATTLDSFQDRHVNARVSDREGENWRIDGYADYLWRDMRGVDASATGAVFDRRNLVETASAQATAIYAGDATAVRLTADGSFYRDQYLNDQRLSDALDTYEITDETLIEGSGQIAHQLGAHRAVIGGELLREALDSDRLSAPGSRTRGAVFAQDEWRIGSEGQLIVVPAARVDFDTQFGTHATPRLATRWQAHPAVVVRASAGLGYHAPTFKDMLLHFENPGVGYVVDGNPDLQPETSRNLQGGVEWQAQPWLWLSANGYYNGLRDLIAAVTLPPDGSDTLKFSYDNIGRARTSGVETFAMATHGRAGLELGYALTRAYDRDAERPLEGIPAHRFTATARWRDSVNRIDAYAGAVLTGRRPFYLSEDPQRATRSPMRTELRARVAKRFTGGIGGFIGVDNLFDAGDDDLDRIPPRTFYAGVELHR